MRTLGERLRAAIEGADISVREFHRRMEARDVAGSSYPNIHRYLSGSSEPTLEFLRQAADVLGVRYWWLSVGQGEPTEEEQSAAQAASGETDRALEAFVTADFFAGLEEEFGEGYERLTLHTRRVDLTRVWNRLAGRRGGVDLGRAVARSIRVPLDELGIGVPYIDEATLDDYVATACAALLRLAEPYHQEKSDG